ncbi:MULTISPECIES: MlaC/ttg2D family ABC transporter substrate-binding protein [unclassified Colwellia]|uniref:MlaC/ttg2D family ABC transporter substrate-binding protein n=1 Tax=unclassified Colwellia TaxID=196834 RepID=UPI0015F6607B|nr:MULTISPECIES: ABC transporter substrate-binding protein [unclassified Colwellia]MBA6231863.1 ABC transporter substrate-binding protein [Colwellia sp. MB02u-7]MBA6235818.1 ABC transporter substrate-binding protein [Colwellia sp. MB02u-11]MBA6254937.1 ABC transporter substrate-binding protein [Colwellia sp. MB3u-28]MBA6259112.1 ABC transporter substrate-binding protein [Colwellia sp. MB3u-41]MBA6298907.1 ABC transporter substrate-binding protein [Colwellia sp. MB3u-22]
MKKTDPNNINIYLLIFLLLSLFISALVIASTANPEVKTKAVFEQIESALLTLKSKNEFTKSNVKGVLTQYLLPEVDVQYFSYKVLNQNLPKISAELRTEFITELSNQLINTYSNLLSKYNGESIDIGTSSISKSGKISMVNITITGEKKVNKAVVKLLMSKEGNWQFFDIIIEGISLLDAKQKEINSSFNKLGIEGTLAHLKNINQRSFTSS